MFVIVDTARYGMDPTDEDIADCAEESGMYLERDDAVLKAYTLPVASEDIMLVDIECDAEDMVLQ